MARRPKFRGRFTHKIDSKGRVSIPSEFRKVLENLGSVDDGKLSVVATLTYGHAVEVYPLDEWEELDERINSVGYLNEAAENLRAMLSSCADLQIDASGRLLIPAWMRADAMLGVAEEGSPDKEEGGAEEVVVIGKSRTFEIWQPQLWAERLQAARKHHKENPEVYDRLGL